MNCEMCEAEEATVTLIPTGQGSPQSIGPACLARMGLEMAKTILPAEEIAHALGPMFVAPARTEALAKASKSKPRKAQKATPAEAAPEGPAGGTTEEPAAAANGGD